jgi:hypothetical protein
VSVVKGNVAKEMADNETASRKSKQAEYRAALDQQVHDNKNQSSPFMSRKERKARKEDDVDIVPTNLKDRPF